MSIFKSYKYTKFTFVNKIVYLTSVEFDLLNLSGHG